jgi:hypothetical protein
MSNTEQTAILLASSTKNGFIFLSRLIDMAQVDMSQQVKRLGGVAERPIAPVLKTGVA